METEDICRGYSRRYLGSPVKMSRRLVGLSLPLLLVYEDEGFHMKVKIGVAVGDSLVADGIIHPLIISEGKSSGWTEPSKFRKPRLFFSWRLLRILLAGLWRLSTLDVVMSFSE